MVSKTVNPGHGSVGRRGQKIMSRFGIDQTGGPFAGDATAVDTADPGTDAGGGAAEERGERRRQRRKSTSEVADATEVMMMLV
jgi:hypothetical protein